MTNIFPTLDDQRIYDSTYIVYLDLPLTRDVSHSQCAKGSTKTPRNVSAIVHNIVHVMQCSKEHSNFYTLDNKKLLILCRHR